jgi:hypothetical protein
MLNGRYKTRGVTPSKMDRKKGIFEAKGLRQALKNQKEVNLFGDDPSRARRPVSGVDKCLQKMADEELIRQVSERPLRYGITTAFEAVFQDVQEIKEAKR